MKPWNPSYLFLVLHPRIPCHRALPEASGWPGRTWPAGHAVAAGRPSPWRRAAGVADGLASWRRAGVVADEHPSGPGTLVAAASVGSLPGPGGKRGMVKGHVPLPVFLSQFKFHGNFGSVSPRFWYSDRYKILYMAQQPCCRGVCKNLLRSNGQQRNCNKAKFASNFNCGQKIVSETGPRMGWEHTRGQD